MCSKYSRSKPSSDADADPAARRGMAVYVGKDVSKLKAKGGGKWKYMSEKDMVSKCQPLHAVSVLIAAAGHLCQIRAIPVKTCSFSRDERSLID